jgi:hypothetical protein
MTLNRVARWLAFGLAAGAAWIGLSSPAQAIPVFARQTGHNCQACHISYPELTAYGREFKLNGYTFGEAQNVPLAFALMAEYTKPTDKIDHSTGGNVCDTVGAQCSPGQLAQWSLFYGGRITENIGMFGQYSSGAFPISQADGTLTGAEDNTEIRWVHRFSTGSTLEDDSVVGLDVNNNLTMQDVWNSVPAWRFPWFPYNQVGFVPAASPAIDGLFGQRAVGFGAYAWIRKTWYAELSLYRKPWGPFSWFVNGAGNNSTLNNSATAPSDVMDGLNPYYRFAYSKDWDYSSFEVGLFGLHAKTFYDPYLIDSAQVLTYNDIGVDAQYQFNRNEPYIYAVSGSFIHEKNNLDPLQAAGGSSNAGNTINEFNIRGTVYYERKYGVSLAWQSINGSSDPILYGQGAAGGSATGSPGSAYWMIELNYLPLQDLRFSLNYQAYTKLNGGNSNFDGLGNNASGQNVLTGAIWWVF